MQKKVTKFKGWRWTMWLMATALACSLAEKTPGAEVGDEEALARRSGCLECHGVAKKIIGPAYQDVAARYKDNSYARDVLIGKVKNGGKGNWTEISRGVPMPPHSGRLSTAEIERLVDWVLSSPFVANAPAAASDAPLALRVLNTGLGSGRVTSNPAGIDCGADCDVTHASPAAIRLTATPALGSTFTRWDGDCSGTARTCWVTTTSPRSVRAVFDLATPIPELTSFTPEGIRAFLIANPAVKTPARFLKTLPREYKQNWILMTRSESLQTGTAEFPRILLPSADARFIFTLGVAVHSSYPGSHPNAIEYMQWDAEDNNFRLHEIVVDRIPPIGVLPARGRGVSADDAKCSKCHSTRNVLNRGAPPGTDGDPPGSIKTKNKPNWDTYDSWGGMAPFNRDRIYQGSVEAAAFRKIFNPWTWWANPLVRSIVEQLELQPPNVPEKDRIWPVVGGRHDGHINFAFDESPPVLREPPPVGDEEPIFTNYRFNGQPGDGAKTRVMRGGPYVTLQHTVPSGDPDEGRGVRYFDLLVSPADPNDPNFNPLRIADELITHRSATGDHPVDIRPLALAITSPGCLSIDEAANRVTSDPPLTINLNFFDARNGMRINQLVEDIESRARSATRRKADIQKLTLDRESDVYVARNGSVNGLVQQYGSMTSQGTSTAMSRIRQEVFRRPLEFFDPDNTVMGGIFVDRELSMNFQPVGLYRYFLEPLGVSVDKWSMGVRARSGTYSFADVFDTYRNVFADELKKSLTREPIPGIPLSEPFDCGSLIRAVNVTLARLPRADAVPTYVDVQRIFNKACIECHGGLDYPPYSRHGRALDLSEEENPPHGDHRLTRSYQRAAARSTSLNSQLYRRITRGSEHCPGGIMPCGGPPLSKADTETIRRWIVGGRPSTEGGSHVRTVDGTAYDFQAAGEFVFLRDEFLEIQARQTALPTEGPLNPNEHTGLTSCVSVTSAVAIGINGQRITYQPALSGERHRLELRVDGELKQVSEEGIPLASGGRIVRSTAPGGIRIEPPGGTVVVITPGWRDTHQLWHMNLNTRHVRATRGVLGAIPPGSWLPRLPDGTSMGPRPAGLDQRHGDLHGRLATAWRVSDATSLFDYAPGLSTAAFTLESWPPGGSPRSCTPPLEPLGVAAKPSMKTLSLAAAQEHCGGITNETRRSHCVRDVRVTGDPGWADTYLLTESLDHNTIPAAPELGLPEDFGTEVLSPVTFTWNPVTDADGDPITYKHCLWDGDQSFNINRCTTLAAATALADVDLESGRTYYWKVLAEDGRGGTVESETRGFMTR